MHHHPRICEDNGWPASRSDDVTFHNSQATPVTISKDPSYIWPFDPPPDYVVPGHGTIDCKILSGIQPGIHHYRVDGCPKEITPKTVIIS
jgi:hypothetical protein